MRRTEVMARQAVGKLFTDLADDYPVLPLAAQQRAEAVLVPAPAATVGRGGVDQVDAQFACLPEQHARGIVIGNLKTVGVFHPLVAAQFDRAQAQRRDRQAGAAQWAVEVGAAGSR